MTVVIAGGGLSGLSLAAHLALETRWNEQVVVVEDGSHPVEAIAWSSWADRSNLLDTAVSSRFDRVRVHVGGRSRTLSLGRFRYQVVRGADFSRVVRHIAEPLGRFEFRHGHVDGITTSDGGARVVVDGEPVEARWVFDSVVGPLDPPPVDARLVFRGRRVRVERPVFDPEAPTLFDFRTSQVCCPAFLYVLPVSPTEALVEHTAFIAPDAPLPGVDAQHAALAAYLDDVLHAGRCEVVHEEGSVLRLTAGTAPRRRGSVLTIGTPAGMVKASTGYSYQRVQRDSAAVVRSLVEHGHPFDLPAVSARHRVFDAALLDVVTRDPRQLERAFAALFRGPSAEPALRFLDERSSIGLESRLFAGMPVGTYLKAVGRRLRT
ncbi:lycopene cyclase family protein [Umezawaea endophytica]|uniref:Lycopene cyclase family protein n=1 Tax=Umezawaea endophytica TaxID=1654476 RepID=A0A9X2VXK4_9PSEU|nr:lycopene cyclase family protein [Umezawaea endophytica]MCS7484750.1 lycopene cyclase family protein [Umezawaea endophytica]